MEQLHGGFGGGREHERMMQRATLARKLLV